MFFFELRVAVSSLSKASCKKPFSHCLFGTVPFTSHINQHFSTAGTVPVNGIKKLTSGTNFLFNVQFKQIEKKIKNSKFSHKQAWSWSENASKQFDLMAKISGKN